MDFDDRFRSFTTLLGFLCLLGILTLLAAGFDVEGVDQAPVLMLDLGLLDMPPCTLASATAECTGMVA